MNPRILKLVSKGYKKKQEIRDHEMWSWFGAYGISALMFSIEHCFADKPKLKYIENPITGGNRPRGIEELSEEERIQAERNRQYMILKVMQTNFELNKSKNN